MLENAEYQVSQAWKVKELFRDLLRLNYHGDMEAYGMLGDWMTDALQYNIEEINGVVFMFKRHLKGIIRSMVTGANNGKAERNQRVDSRNQDHRQRIWYCRTLSDSDSILLWWARHMLTHTNYSRTCIITNRIGFYNRIIH